MVIIFGHIHLGQLIATIEIELAPKEALEAAQQTAHVLLGHGGHVALRPVGREVGPVHEADAIGGRRQERLVDRVEAKFECSGGHPIFVIVGGVVVDVHLVLSIAKHLGVQPIGERRVLEEASLRLEQIPAGAAAQLDAIQQPRQRGNVQHVGAEDRVVQLAAETRQELVIAAATVNYKIIIIKIAKIMIIIKPYRK